MFYDAFTPIMNKIVLSPKKRPKKLRTFYILYWYLIYLD